MDLLASKVDALAEQFDRLGTPSSGSLAGSSSGAMFEVQALFKNYCIQAMLLPGANPIFRELSMLMLYKTSAHAHKTTPTQTLTTLVEEIT